MIVFGSKTNLYGAGQAIIDYRMSEKFGLDWRKYDQKRMIEFMNIMVFENERQELDAKKSQKGYGRKR